MRRLRLTQNVMTFNGHVEATYARNEVCVVVVAVRTDVTLSVNCEVVERCVRHRRVNGDEVGVSPHFNADQHQVDALRMIQLQQQTEQQTDIYLF